MVSDNEQENKLLRDNEDYLIDDTKWFVATDDTPPIVWFDPDDWKCVYGGDIDNEN